MKESIDFFSHNIIAKKISTIFSKQNAANSFVIAINGAWGTGKTHLMTNVLSGLDDYEYIKINFNAWRYAVKEDIKRSLLICIIDTCRKYVESDDKRSYLGWSDKELKIVEQLIDDTERALYTAFIKETPGEISIDTGNLLKNGVNMALKFVPWGNFGNDFIQKFLAKKGGQTTSNDVYVEKEDIEELWGIFTRSSFKRNIEKVVGVEQFRKSLETLLAAILEGKYDKLREHYKDVKLIVAIDDLDRCLPEDAIDVLEAIKLFVDYPNTYFMLAMDGNIIQNGLNMRYNNYESITIWAKDYYEKMIDLSFHIPAFEREKFFLYIKSLSPDGEYYIGIYAVLFIALNTNLRAWQRYIQRTDFNKDILEEIAEEDIFCDDLMRSIFMKLQCFSYQWPELYRTINDRETYILLERQLAKVSDYQKKDLESILDELGRVNVPENVRHAIIDKKIMDFILAEPTLGEISDKNTLNIFFTFDKIVS